VGVAGRRFARSFGLLFVLPAVGGGLLAVALLSVHAAASPGSTRAAGTRPAPTVPSVQPIAIQARACPYLEAVHDAGYVAHHAPAGPHASAPLPKLERSLRESAMHVPEPLRLKLELAADLAEQLAMMKPDSIASYPSFEAFDTGLGAIDDANHLVGTACGFRPADRPFLFWP
jgi:hypothetical protein